MNTNAEIVWKNCLKFIQDNISVQNFSTWFAPIKALKLHNNVLTIQVPTKFFYEWLEEHYIKLLKVALTKELGNEAKLVYSIVMDRNQNATQPNTVTIPSTQKLPLKPQEVDAPFQLERTIKNPFIIPGLQKIKIDSQLNNNYTFDNFIEGDNNRLVRSAGLAVAQKPGGTAFNPLFIYGGVGLGKTHLAHAIGLDIMEQHPNKTVLYVSTEKFTQQFTDAVRNNNRNDFINFYQMIDVLIIDDIHFLSGKRKTQEVFFQIFNHLHQKGNQIILTSDKSPIEIQDVEQRLISRFKWGLSADIQTPDYDTRLSILKHKAYKDGIQFDEEIFQYIAEKIKTNIRELEGALISIIAQASLNKKEITLDLTQNTINSFISNTRKEISIDFIQNIVCEYFKVPVDKMQSKIRKRDIVQARQLAMYFAKKYTNASLAHIGSKIGNRDHATVLHACKTVKNLSETDKVFKGYLEDLNKKINIEA